VTTATPTKPWRATPKAMIPNFVAALLVIGGTWFLIEFTGLAGKLGAFLAASFLAIVLLSLVAGIQRGGQAAKNAAIGTFVAIGSIVALFPVVSILGTVLVRGVRGIYVGFFASDMSLASVNDPLDKGGILHAIIGTLLLILFAMLISVPLGILTALYLTEIKGPGSRLIRFLVQAMSGVPSIVSQLWHELLKKYSYLFRRIFAKLGWP